MKVKIGGVPEHFNYPWLNGIENNIFEAEGIELHWQDFHGGTGAMCKALKNNELDLALLLTEGAVKEICSGGDFKIVKTYVESPLNWGIHSAKKNKKADLKNLAKMRYAISRFGSGSHLMAYVHAQTHGFQLTENQMVIVGDLQGARKSLANIESDLFFWEKFMTKPLVDSEEFQLLDTFPTPWPCFVLVAKNDFFQSDSKTITTICKLINKQTELLSQDSFTLIDSISVKYNLPKKDVETWLNGTKWNYNFEIKKESFTKVTNSLFSLGMIDFHPSNSDLIHQTVSLI